MNPGYMIPNAGGQPQHPNVQMGQMMGHNPNYNPQQVPSVAYPSSNSKFTAKAWHSHEHSQARTQMVEEIIKLLKNRRPNATDDWHEKLPHMAKRLEDALYHDANTFDDYSDKESLKVRLQQLAMSMSNKTNVPHNPQPRDPRMLNLGALPMNVQPGQLPPMPLQLPPGQIPHNQLPQGGGVPGGVNNPRSIPAYPQQIPPPQFAPQALGNQQYPARTAIAAASQYSGMQPGMMPNASLPQMNGLSTMYPPNGNDYSQQRNPPNLIPPVDNRGVYNPAMDSSGMLINNNMAPNQRGFPAPIIPPGQYIMPDDTGNMYMGGNTPNQQQQQQQQQQLAQQQQPAPQQLSQQQQQTQQQQQQQPPQLQAPIQSHNLMQLPNGQHPMTMQTYTGSSNPNNSNNPAGEEHRKQVLKQQQQRLLLLRHASKCPHDRGCPVTPHCMNMKELWRHIMTCKNQDCKTAHCVSSRYVLSHYSKCKEYNCPVCGPVRDAIKRNYIKSQNILDSIKGPNVANGMPPNMPHPGMHPIQNGGNDIEVRMQLGPPNMGFPSVPGINNIGQPGMGMGSGMNMAMGSQMVGNPNFNNSNNNINIRESELPLNKRPKKATPTGEKKKKGKLEGGNVDDAGRPVNNIGAAVGPGKVKSVGGEVKKEKLVKKRKIMQLGDDGQGDDQMQYHQQMPYQQQQYIGGLEGGPVDNMMQQGMMHLQQQQQQQYNSNQMDQDRQREQRSKEQLVIRTAPPPSSSSSNKLTVK